MIQTSPTSSPPCREPSFLSLLMSRDWLWLRICHCLHGPPVWLLWRGAWTLVPAASMPLIGWWYWLPCSRSSDAILKAEPLCLYPRDLEEVIQGQAFLGRRCHVHIRDHHCVVNIISQFPNGFIGFLFAAYELSLNKLNLLFFTESTV